MIGFALNQSYVDNDGKTQQIIGGGFNDWYLDANHQIATKTDAKYMLQNINNAIWLFLNEYEYDLTLGTPYPQLLGNTPIDKTLLVYHLRRNILNINNFIPDANKADLTIKESMVFSFEYNNEHRILTPTIYLQLANGTKYRSLLDLTNQNSVTERL